MAWKAGGIIPSKNPAILLGNQNEREGNKLVSFVYTLNSSDKTTRYGITIHETTYMILKKTAMVLPEVTQSEAIDKSPTVQPHCMSTTPSTSTVDQGIEQTHAS